MTRALVALAVLAAHAAHAAPPRAAQVAAALEAVRALGHDGRDRLDRAIYEAARAACPADRGSPAAACLIDAARAACAADPARARCEAAADVIAANLRAVPAWLDEPTRVRLVRGSADYRAALAAELSRRYALLAAELALADRAGDDAAAIDLLCARRDRVAHPCAPGDAACVPSLAWSRCVAALVWFVGGSS